MFEGKKIKVILSKSAEKEYGELNKLVNIELKKGQKSSLHQSIFRSIERVLKRLKENPFAGQQIKRKIIPKQYFRKYGLTNLYRIELANRWRMLYTIKTNEIEILNFILDIVDHKRYDKILKY